MKRRLLPHPRWLFDSPLVVATWIAVLLGAWSMQQVGQALRHAELVRQQSDRELARLAAEAGVRQLPLAPHDDGEWVQRVGSVEVHVERRGDELLIESVLPDGTAHRYESRVQAGASPLAFASAHSTALPRFDERALAAAVNGRDLPAFRRDDGIALLHFDGGTDLDDYVLQEHRSGIDAMAGAVIDVPGHLWIETGSAPLTVRCNSDVTVIVRGNLYVGRSLEVLGAGRLVLATVAVASATPFSDRDGNGRRSTGEGPDVDVGSAIEGSGSVYLGLDKSAASLMVGSGLVVSGYLHVARDTEVDGPAVVSRPLVTTEPNARLLPTGRRLFHAEREVVPGFALAGLPRPGLLSEAAARSSAARQQALYLTGSAR